MSAVAKRIWHFFFLSEHWKRVMAWVVVYGYVFNVLLWPYIFWGTTILTLRTEVQWPAPPLVPWEQLAAMSGTLAAIGAIQVAKARRDPTESQDI